MYRYSQQMRQNTTNSQARMRVLAVLLVIALVGCGVLGVQYYRSARLEEKTRQQLLSRVRSCCTDAKNLSEKLATSVQSNTASQLANIRQSVYAMDQLNATAIALFGEGGRLVPTEAIAALYEDLDSYFSIIQTNTVSVLETRALMINHLTALQGLLSQ